MHNHAQIQRGTGGPDPQLRKSQNIGFLSNTGPDPIKNHEATKQAFNVGPSSTRQRNAIKMVFCWRADDGPLLWYFDPSSPHQTKKKRCHSWTSSDKTFWIRT